MQSSRQTPWPSILLLGLSSLSLFFFFSSSLVMGIMGIYEHFSGNPQNAESNLLLSMGMLFLGAATLPAIYYSFMHVSNRQAKPIPFNKVSTLFLIIAWIVVTSAAVFLSSMDAPAILTAPLNSIALVLPIWILIRIGLQGLESVSDEWRWGVFTLGISVVPIVISVIELAILIMGGFTVLIGMVMNPNSLQNLESLSMRLMYTTNPDAIIRVISPYLFNPMVMASGLVFFSILIPIIEEVIKPLGVWIAQGRISTPQQGFILGVLGGAAFAMVESLGMSPGIPGSTNTLPIVRAGTDVLHIATTSLMGWALASAWTKRKFFQLGITFLIVITIHGLWNMLALASAAQIALEYLPNPSPWMTSAPMVSGIGIFLMTIINLVILVIANNSIRKTVTLSS